MKMKKLLRYIPFYKVTKPVADLHIKGLSMDSRTTEPGDVFVCLRGVDVDGHRFAKGAVERGAVAVIAEEEVALSVPVVLVNDTSRALAMASAAFYGCPSESLHVIGVTGTNGKTTITYLLEEIFQQHKKKTGIIGTIQVNIAGETFPVKNTTPDALTLQRYFHKMHAAGVDHAIMEVSSHALDQGRVFGCDFDIAVFTNLTQDHLDYHENFDDYLRAKSLLFAQLGNGYNKEREKFAVINNDSPQAKKFIRSTSQGLLTYGIFEKADIKAEEYTMTETGTAFIMTTPIGSVSIKSPLMGLFSIYNMLAAAGAAILSGVPLETIQRSFQQTKGVRGRFEPVREGQGFGVVVDYAHTPDSLKNVLQTLRDLCKGTITVVVGCGGDRDRSKRPEMAKVSVDYADRVIFTNDNPRTEDPKQIFRDMTTHVKGRYKLIEDRKEAITYAIEHAKTGDIVLIAGKGHETYQEVKGIRHHFDDCEVARTILREMKEHPS
ncbi:UDP-N-acetylmuramoyl-L-alanyl-D-glutamate--2,6-diaminopimelate ligase [Halobacillus sp. Nhm2S1]|uniref:UDP-N-acetylmuramoyl-L-alanyl-D-glutamate--2, 6-diaminopimelate ligase n=1 Tax=Halobacillus sp. Nhm2S1 TaxID=2866716 RepID=UPI001C72B5C3|nr:UDP-N-acetylmuramoyl-L-alanyl-D-glutamate--2,6-diaminopimelate ligase [Halobacillus sp. Nhm2S1]MBX0356541.1 UDP-N-acetylmuramoyl-L-alanyl-D-glutamate--2,6-diaminopimelate ligase [Halobacillus sp. Nhm2S1]